jgi:3-hydroxyisobutyrate dehydrogenase
MESTHEPVAVLGIGAMGHGMATSALRAGIRTIVWNRNSAASRDLAALSSRPRSRVTPSSTRLASAPSGSARSRLKLVKNTWVAFAAEAAASSVALAHRLGLDTETVMDALAGSPLVSAWQAAKLQRIAKDDFSAQFALSLALKDVRLALQAAGEDRFAALACLADEWQQVVDQGLGDRDLTVVTLALQRQGGSP